MNDNLAQRFNLWDCKLYSLGINVNSNSICLFFLILFANVIGNDISTFVAFIRLTNKIKGTNLLYIIQDMTRRNQRGCLEYPE